MGDFLLWATQTDISVKECSQAVHVHEHEHTHSRMRHCCRTHIPLCVCSCESCSSDPHPTVCVCVSALRWSLCPSMHPRGPGQAPATNFDPPRIPNCTISATLPLALWGGVYRYTPPKTCLALCEHSPLFASLCCSCPRPRCVLPYSLCMAQGCRLRRLPL